MSVPIQRDHRHRLTAFFKQVRLTPSKGSPVADSEVSISRSVEECAFLSPDHPDASQKMEREPLPSLRLMREDYIVTMLEARRGCLLAREQTVAESLLPTPSVAEHLSDRVIELARTVVVKIELDKELPPEEARTLEEIILPGDRPVIDIIDGSFITYLPSIF